MNNNQDDDNDNKDRFSMADSYGNHSELLIFVLALCAMLIALLIGHFL